ncbi:hypothetical protein BC351_16050 [Paenibacillus ferrarius]|uniref:Uncharacterized protein n=1 Tax=Paenibacillus ferrarius TaxID=1469647 RepID=A0A1V4HQJ2_9BACL|nr:hypothetical protein [Paenibacillus ferrarius]OPH60714.1 hypothetical protein BC351_16050 [Paenibacillus ferrarius]
MESVWDLISGKPAIVQAFVALICLLDKNARKACIIAGFSLFALILLKKPAFSQALRMLS